MDYGISITIGRPDSATSDSGPSTSQVPPSSTEVVTTVASTTVEPVTSTTADPTANPSSTTTSNGMTSDTSSSIIISTISTSDMESTTSSSTRPIDSTTLPGATATTTNPPSSTATTPPKSTAPPLISTSKEISTSTPVTVVTVTTSGTIVRTYTSISYSSYVTHVATTMPDQARGNEDSPNVGAIAGGVIGGVAAVVLIGLIVILLTKRRRNKHKEKTGGGGADIGNDYDTYGSPTVMLDNNSQPGSGTLSHSQGIKPRPFVQAYNPTYDGQQQHADYDGALSPPQDPYYNDYQPYNNTYTNTGVYSHDAYHAQQQEPMIPASTSHRNVPDENDYDLSRKVSRHVPDEVPSVPHTK